MTSTAHERISFLLGEYVKFQKAVEYFQYSLQDVSGLHISSTNTQEELIRIEALTSRFERMIDLFLNKISRYVVLCETGSDEGTIRDKLLFLAKLQLVADAELWLDMRTLRNMIAHDYLYQEHQEFFDIIEKLANGEIAHMMQALANYMQKWTNIT